ncbi:DNA methyltransferase [Ancylobacter polymorphus]|uniref:site-specific DNA-methyltransferase (adenine-specific) n=1 Tax=Ancylobacter polymorphus TaxID=223390 RepID=A0ABU0BHK1_9HYPH|nr:DNA methyltransferase [Ancylobacter polymorphus]MDQ0305310.1 DNA modification methylase [Ancylobacter polymorphus]
MNAPTSYRQFLEAKMKVAPSTGFSVPLEEINPDLKPFTRAVVQWAAAGGCRGIFASFGLHKTSTQIELCRLLKVRAGGEALIVLPLGVRQEFFRDARLRFQGDFAVSLRFIQSEAELEAARADGGGHIYLTNYETIREGKLDPGQFTIACLDEASILRSFGSKTFQTFLPLFDKVRFRFVATATPSPNRFKEIIHYAGFLGIMDTGQALTRFFQRNSEKAGDLTLYPHKEHEFWMWVSTWAVFLQKPSDLGFSDEGYDLPPLTVRWHEVPVDLIGSTADRDGQMALIRPEAKGLSEEARERRAALPACIARMREIIAADPESHRILWHDLEDERRAIEAAVPGVRSVFGTQDLAEREDRIISFSDGGFPFLAAKPVMLGSGCNLQRHCHKAVFLGVGHKFNDFIQAVHRIQRFGQEHPVEIDIIYPESMRAARRDLEAKWARHEEMAARMSEIIRKHGLSLAGMAEVLQRSIGVQRIEASGEGWLVANNDCVEECRRMENDSVDLIVTSIPFSNHYEYTPTYDDFGHTDDDDHFFGQMDFLTPELLRILKPGRMACIHVKDRIMFGSVTGMGTPTVNPFHMTTTFHFRKHGFAYMGMVTIDTDVVRENNQTYRLGWTENAKDSSKMGFGSPEYLLVFRKLPTDRSRAYADEPVTKQKPHVEMLDGRIVEFDDKGRPIPGSGYSRARWQTDAHARWRSSGNRLLTADEIAQLDPSTIGKVFKQFSMETVYDYETHVRIGEQLDYRGVLPAIFMSLWPASTRPDVWHDVDRMRTLNTAQASAGRELHVCPLQFDIVDRCINRYTNPGELVFDPFGGLFTVPNRAVRMGRRGRAAELHHGYFLDGVKYLEALDRKKATPSLFDFLADGVAAPAEAAE